MSIMDYVNEQTQDGIANLVTMPPEKGAPEKYDTYTHLREELSKISSGLEITLTFNPVIHDQWSPEMLTHIVRSYLQSKQDKYPCSIILVGEFSEVGRYHFHGIIKATPRVINYYKRNLKNEFGRVEFKMIHFVESYLNYVLKSYYNMKLEHSTKGKIPYNLFIQI